MRILVVDDIESVRGLIVNGIKQFGHPEIEISTADDGISALKILLNDRFDLVIADWNMPGLSGINLLKAIRNNPDLRHIKFLMVTGEAKVENIILAKSSGVNDYIVKPFAQATLWEKIEKMFNLESAKPI